MTSILLQECSAEAPQDVVRGMENIEWQRSCKSLLGASSAPRVLTQQKWSLMDAIL